MKINATFPLGVPLPRYNIAALVSATTKTVVVTVPTNEVWLIRGGYAYNGDSVIRDVTVTFKDYAGNTCFLPAYHAALAAANPVFFNSNAQNDTGFTGFPFLMFAGESLTFFWSAGVAGAGGDARYAVIGEKINV